MAGKRRSRGGTSTLEEMLSSWSTWSETYCRANGDRPSGPLVTVICPAPSSIRIRGTRPAAAILRTITPWAETSLGGWR